MSNYQTNKLYNFNETYISNLFAVWFEHPDKYIYLAKTLNSLNLTETNISVESSTVKWTNGEDIDFFDTSIYTIKYLLNKTEIQFYIEHLILKIG